MWKSIYSPVAMLLSAAIGLSACNATKVAPSTAVPSPAPVKTLAQVAGNDLTKACNTVKVAIGYYNDVAWAMPVTVTGPAGVAIAGVNLICNAPSGNLTSDLVALNALWVKIQAYTTVLNTRVAPGNGGYSRIEDSVDHV